MVSSAWLSICELKGLSLASLVDIMEVKDCT